ncbi:MAG TPA: PadR family transcriptional regulator [Bacillota bacterium]|jgi:DNA-binding PadR family transcriptional regulator
MLELAILGLLKDGPVHGYELKGKVGWVTGAYRPVSDGALYPAIGRLEAKGLLERHPPSAGKTSAPRVVLSLTAAGEAEFLERLRRRRPADVSNAARYFVILAFFGHLTRSQQGSLLRRRLAFLRNHGCRRCAVPFGVGCLS